VRPSSAGELPPLERTGSPTGAEKDILVYAFVLISFDFRNYMAAEG